MHVHNFSLTELDMMMPYEREIYTMLLMDYLDKKEKQKGG
jgi:hypothetical protein